MRGISSDITKKNAKTHSHEEKADIFSVEDKIEVNKSKKHTFNKIPEIESSPKIPKDKEIELTEEDLPDTSDYGFFDPKKPEVTKEKSSISPIWGYIFNVWVLWIVFFVLLAILAYQNQDAIKELIKFNKKVEEIAVVNPVKTETTTPTTEDTTPAETTEATTPAETTTPTTTTTPATTTPSTTTATLDKAAVKLEVLNGNGIRYSASSVVTTLTKAGFKVSRTANAKKFSYATTIIYFKTGQEEAAKAVAAALSTRQVSTELDDAVAGTYDVVVVVGKQ
jgi:cytoskeletal protein RodZ